MSETLLPRPVTDAAGFLPGPLGLRLDEEFLPLMSLSGSTATLDMALPFGQVRSDSTGLCLRLWPDVIWASGLLPEGDFRETDISHGVTHLRLRGVEALHFVAQYTRADLHSAPIRQARAVRTRLNHYDCTIWWTNTRDVHIVTDRSLAQSLTDHLRALSLRHPPADPSKTPRPVAPDAPDRRG
ncbi:hypothetical protein K3727_23675 (plasmid) [Rhodobacteraceae bacterium M382]|nr:hypothetical protein K3727_23675 [Rhodobacteraceae bacterium M382]